MQDDIFFVNFFQLRFAFACKKQYICMRESLSRLSLFSCFHANKEAIWAKMQTKSSAISFQYAPFHPAKCAILEDNLPKIAR